MKTDILSAAKSQSETRIIKSHIMLTTSSDETRSQSCVFSSILHQIWKFLEIDFENDDSLKDDIVFPTSLFYKRKWSEYPRMIEQSSSSWRKSFLNDDLKKNKQTKEFSQHRQRICRLFSRPTLYSLRTLQESSAWTSLAAYMTFHSLKQKKVAARYISIRALRHLWVLRSRAFERTDAWHHDIIRAARTELIEMSMILNSSSWQILRSCPCRFWSWYLRLIQCMMIDLDEEDRFRR